MKRVLAGLALAVLAVVAVRAAWVALASDETKVRWMVEEMVEGFNEGSAKRATSGFAETWSHRGEPVRRDDLRGYLLVEFQQQRSRRARTLTLRAAVPEESLAVAIDGDGGSLRLELWIDRLRGEEWTPQWRMRVEAELRREDGGWRIVAADKQDLEGSGLRG